MTQQKAMPRARLLSSSLSVDTIAALNLIFKSTMNSSLELQCRKIFLLGTIKYTDPAIKTF